MCKKLNIRDHFEQWVPYIVSGRNEIVVALDWTDFDSDGQTTIALNLLTSYGRALPLVWRTVRKSGASASELKRYYGKRWSIETYFRAFVE